MSNSLIYVIITVFLAVMMITTAIRAADDISQRKFEKRSEQHWEDVEKCEEAGGQVVLGKSQWFEYCILP